MKPRMFLIIIIWRTWIKQSTTITCERNMVDNLVVSLANPDIEEIIVVEKQEEKEEEKND